ncbi:uncharacterized protein LOC131246416 [Magnolia sinica]|uniref:uncharacterized protein LOC131246416 n=1 Tax=Magnolia sinica TaxID=86752 RepID=UPI00265B067E|nr:uncharacterized protein LOC131246416 [Magnolia sinica]
MASYSCEEVMPMEVAIQRELAFQRRRRRIDGQPFQSLFGVELLSDSPSLPFPLPQPAIADSFLLLERDLPRKRLQEAAAAAVAAAGARATLEVIPFKVAMQRELLFRRRAERGPLQPRSASGPPNLNVAPHLISDSSNIPEEATNAIGPKVFQIERALPRSHGDHALSYSGAASDSPNAMVGPIAVGRKPACKGLLEKAAAVKPLIERKLQSRSHVGESSSTSSQGLPPMDLVGMKRKVMAGDTTFQQRSYNQPRALSQQAGSLFCNLCQVSCSSVFNLYQHHQGKQHKAMLEKPKKVKEKIIGQFSCDVCKISCSDMSSLVQHRAGRKHAAQLQAIKAQKKPRQ